ncbi:MAG: hypothetical protein JXM70_28335 [Pirellulales bacterium]|nr:hypothetical protein [Pirellulales bacterium]
MQPTNRTQSTFMLRKNSLSNAMCVACLRLTIIFAVTILPSYQARGEKTAPVLGVTVRSYPEPGKVLVSIDVPSIESVGKDAAVKLEVTMKKTGGESLDKCVKTTACGMREEIALDATELSSGDYSVVVELFLPDGKSIKGKTNTVHWPGRAEAFKNIHVLNNFVWELLNKKATSDHSLNGTHTFQLPYDRWIFVRSTASESKSGTIRVSLRTIEGDIPLTLHGPNEPRTAEAMRPVKSGKHTIVVAAEGQATLDHIEVRAVPQIMYSRHPTPETPVKQGVVYDWEFLRKHLLPNANTIVVGKISDDMRPAIAQWKKRGGRVISYNGRPGLHGKSGLEADAQTCFEYWAKHRAYSDPLSDGALVDEFYREEDPAYPVYTDVAKMLNAKFPDKAFYPYAAGVFGRDRNSVPFAKACIEGGGYVCWEAYLAECPTLNQALRDMRRYPHYKIIPFEKRLPGVTRKIIWAFGAYSFPWPWADVYADVNYTAYLDMQFEFIATHPALFGLGGVDIWRSGYLDEERLRWIGRFYRHYCIEGNTARLGTDPYLLTHIGNPDFTEGVAGWTLDPAEEGAIEAGEEKGFGRFIMRYSRGPDTFLVTKRNSKKPNTFSQEIRGLETGKLYSIKMYSGDYSGFLRGKTEKKLNAVSMNISGVELLSGPRYSYQYPFPNKASLGEFKGRNLFWLNFHWQVFRAKGPTATLSISDWKSPDNPGGPVGQQLLYTFIEVKPYMKEH